MEIMIFNVTHDEYEMFLRLYTQYEYIINNFYLSNDLQMLFPNTYDSIINTILSAVHTEYGNINKLFEKTLLCLIDDKFVKNQYTFYVLESDSKIVHKFTILNRKITITEPEISSDYYLS